jgi:hypothetical protein
VADRFCEAIKELTAEGQSRTYAAQWVMVHSVARHLGISDEQAQEAIRAAGHRLKCERNPPHSVSLIYGLSLLKSSTGHGIGLPTKRAAEAS